MSLIATEIGQYKAQNCPNMQADENPHAHYPIKKEITTEATKFENWYLRHPYRKLVTNATKMMHIEHKQMPEW